MLNAVGSGQQRKLTLGGLVGLGSDASQRVQARQQALGLTEGHFDGAARCEAHGHGVIHGRRATKQQSSFEPIRTLNLCCRQRVDVSRTAWT
eukprot:365333-Chlamydomonas_euryale.AAC.11